MSFFPFFSFFSHDSFSLCLSSLFFSNLPFAPLRFCNSSFLDVFDRFLPFVLRVSPSPGAAFADASGGAAPVPGGGFPPGRSSSSSSSSSSSVSSISSSSSSSSSSSPPPPPLPPLLLCRPDDFLTRGCFSIVFLGRGLLLLLDFCAAVPWRAFSRSCVTYILNTTRNGACPMSFQLIKEKTFFLIFLYASKNTTGARARCKPRA